MDKNYVEPTPAPESASRIETGKGPGAADSALPDDPNSENSA